MKSLVISNKFPRMARRYARAFSNSLCDDVDVCLLDGGTADRHLIWGDDIFLGYPDGCYVDQQDDDYPILRDLYQKNKPQQRRFLHEQGISIPETIHGEWSSPPLNTGRDEHFVVRPLRHTRGRSYYISHHPCGWDPQLYYYSRVFPKRWEYRVFVSQGEPLITAIKKHDGRSDTLPGYQRPWNRRAGYKFITVRNMENNRLRYTNLFDKIRETAAFRAITMAALDVMLTKDEEHGWIYAVSELNFAPLVTVPANLQLLSDHYALNRD